MTAGFSRCSLLVLPDAENSDEGGADDADVGVQ
jgi:hypothetical protein